ncbi:AAA family ATPase [Thorsellia anophelis]|uniref:AAA domain-containing protein, putative AbiEii toxin, Type IV TA system n=1 Tax=Thorsellia anophelis DSM 18579 TaxID=1123402 RepID=A0A1I0B882_9GAMM|nr:AAA family ATPase [Thorsellia anophelis]SET02927.1 AAA domain-containing protein, putative AbiEii toxin, Type IV TA system [Thorsellia anophelis DSM 18579]
MRLKRINIINFKRFSNLTIEDIPQSAKLVILTGPNGSGKTCIFEAFNAWMSLYGYNRGITQEEYWSKSSDIFNKNEIWDNFDLKIKLEWYNNQDSQNLMGDVPKKKYFYIRTAYRFEPDFTLQSLKKVNNVLENLNRPNLLISTDTRVSDNYLRLAASGLSRVWSNDETERALSVGELQKQLIGEIKQSVENVFDDLKFEGLGNVLESGTFRFTKGDSKNFHYKNLSGGEKAAFDLLLDFIVKKTAFDNTVYCIDEPELHMHTRLQSKLLDEVFRLLPDNCQLWISTHSIGMVRKATELNKTNPGEVAFIDFHERDFDQDAILTPTQPNRLYCKNMFSTALDDLADLLAPEYLVFCEGKKLGDTTGSKPSFDVGVYKVIFSQRYPNAEFVPLGGTGEVKQNSELIITLLSKITPNVKCWSIYDRDDRAPHEIEELKTNQVYVLDRRDIESYLWDDEVLDKLCMKYGKPESIASVLAQKALLISELKIKNKPADDIKAISGKLYDFCKNELSLTGRGQNAEAFATDTLAKLITPDLQIYQELERAVMAPLLVKE